MFLIYICMKEEPNKHKKRVYSFEFWVLLTCQETLTCAHLISVTIRAMCCHVLTVILLEFT
jgi:hypothetical protein